MYPLILVVLCDMANIRIHRNCSFKNCAYLAMEKKKEHKTSSPYILVTLKVNGKEIHLKF